MRDRSVNAKYAQRTESTSYSMHVTNRKVFLDIGIRRKKNI